MANQQSLILYVRPHCHLCTQARSLLSSLGLPFEMVNIDNDAALQSLYTTLIPVLFAPWADEELIYPFDADRCLEWLATLPTP